MAKYPMKQTKARTTGTDEWKGQRLPLAHTPVVTNPQPHREDFATDAEFLVAHEQWLSRGAKLGPQATRRVTKAVDTDTGPRRHALAGKYDPDYDTAEVGVITLSPSRAELEAKLAEQQDMRALLPTATLADIRGYVMRHGHLPHGGAVPATDGKQWKAAVAAMEARLRGELPPLDDD